MGCDYTTQTSALEYNGTTFSCMNAIASGMGLNEVLQIFGNKICELSIAIAGVTSFPGQLSSDNVLYNGSSLTNVLAGIISDISGITVPQVQEFDSSEYTFSGDFVAQWNAKECTTDITTSTTMDGLFLVIADMICKSYDDVVSISGEIHSYYERIIKDDGNAVIGSEQGTLTTSTSSLFISVATGLYMIDGQVIRINPRSILLTANKDSYIEVASNGEYHVVEVGNGDPVPPLESSLRIWKVVTNGSGVTSTTDLRNLKFMTTEFLEDESIGTTHIAANAVTSAKMSNVIAAATVGFPELFQFTWDAAGRLTGVVARVSTGTGLVDGDILRYNVANARFERYAFSGGSLPAGTANYTMHYTGGSWAASSFLVNTGTALGIGTTTPNHPVHVGVDRWVAFSMNYNAAPTISVQSGGSLTASTRYYYRLVFVDSNLGETPGTSEVFTDTTLTDKTVRLVATVPPGTVYVKVFRSTTTSVYTECFTTQDTIIYDDGTEVMSPATIPTTNNSMGVEIGYRGFRAGSDDDDSTVDIIERANHRTKGIHVEMLPNEMAANLYGVHVKVNSENSLDNVAYYAEADNSGAGQAFALFGKSGILYLASGGAITDANTNQIAQFDSTSKGVQLPRMTTAQRDAVTWGAIDNGTIIYNTTTHKFQGRANNAWADLN